MDWRKTKTIFIITFLILNIFLASQIFEKRDENQWDLITEATIEEQFEADEITYENLPKETVTESYISGKSYKFSVEDKEALEKKGQTVEIVNETVLVGAFKDPIPAPENDLETKLPLLMKDQLLFNDKYDYKFYNKEEKELIFFQSYKKGLIYSNNESGMLSLYLDDENNIVSYKQTLISDLEEMDEAQELLTAFNALENLYNMNELKPGSHVTDVKLGYYTLVQITSSHVLTPTWHIVVNGEQDFFVNALEGQIIRKEKRILE